jgi:nucleotide-binding universal stress UspA family protein
MTVVATTDGTERSLRVVPHAAQLAIAARQRLTLLRVLDPRVDCKSVVAPTLREAVRRVSEEWAAEMRGSLAERGIDGDVVVASRLHGEEMPDTILGAAAEAGASAIASDTHGGGLLRHAFLGSHALDMLRKADIPLLLTGPAAEAPVIGDRYEVFFTSDGSPAAESALTVMGPLLAATRAAVTFWQAVVPRTGDMGQAAELEAARSRLEWLARHLPPGTDYEVVVEPAAGPNAVPRLAVDRALESGAMAMAMSTHGHSARYHVLAGSVALAMLQQSPLPILMARARNEIAPRI